VQWGPLRVPGRNLKSERGRVCRGGGERLKSQEHLSVAVFDWFDVGGQKGGSNAQGSPMEKDAYLAT